MNRIASPPPSGYISGIVLHVDAYGEQLPEALTYYKAHTQYIAIGRRPTQQKGASGDDNRALFRCAVVSRKHAKITFTEFGNAYIIDLHSHHGTHILRPGDTVSRMIEPESPTVLADGDVLTFGKSVGKDNSLVRPVTVRVKLIFGSQPVLAPLDFEATPQPMERVSSRFSSRRYGIPLSTDVSSSSDGESDIEEVTEVVSPPSSLLPVQAPCTSGYCSSLATGRLALLRRLLPPIHSSLNSRDSPRSVSPDVDHLSFFEEEMTDVAVRNCVREALEISEQAADIPPPPFIRDLLLAEPNVVGAYPDSPIRPVSPTSDVHPSVEEPLEMAVDCHNYPISERDDYMDRVLAEGCDLDFEPSVSDCRTSVQNEHSPFISNAGNGADDITERIAGEESLPLPSVEVGFGQGVAEHDEGVHSYPTPSPEQGHCCVPSCRGNTVDSPADGADASVAIASLERQINNACDDITLLRMTSRENEDLFQEHVRQTKARLDDLRDHMDIHIMSNVHVNTSNLTNMQSRLDGLQEKMEHMESRLASKDQCTVEPEVEIDGHKALLEEVRALREETAQQIAIEFEAIKAARLDAEAAVTKAVADAQLQMAASRMKRKFSDLEDTQDSHSVQDNGSPSERPVIQLSKRRKTMKVVSRIAQTATVATVGAIAAWAALAFA
ncbi:hypothetical protein BKA93DRAFT_755205 [Sparassis latifolia]